MNTSIHVRPSKQRSFCKARRLGPPPVPSPELPAASASAALERHHELHTKMRWHFERAGDLEDLVAEALADEDEATAYRLDAERREEERLGARAEQAAYECVKARLVPAAGAQRTAQNDARQRARGHIVVVDRSSRMRGRSRRTRTVAKVAASSSAGDGDGSSSDGDQASDSRHARRRRGGAA